MALGSTIREFGVSLSLLFNKKNFDQAETAVETLAGSLKSLSIKIGGATASLLGMADVASSHARAIEVSSQQLGVSTTALQEYGYATKIAADINQEQFTASLEGMSKALYDAKNNNFEAAKAYIRVGVSQDLFTSKTATSIDILNGLSDTFSKMQDGYYKTSLAAEIGVRDLLPLLNKGRAGIAQYVKEGHALGAVLGPGQIAQGAEFDRQFSKIWVTLKNISYTIGGELIKYLGPLVLQFQKFLIANKQLIAQKIAQTFLYLGKALTGVFKYMFLVGQGMGQVIKYVGGLKTVLIALGAAFVALNFQAIAFTAAFGLVFLIIQDLASKDSVIKEWLGNLGKSFSGLIDTFKSDFPNAVKFLVGVFDILKVMLNDLVIAGKAIGDFFSGPFIEGVKDTAKAVGMLAGDVGSLIDKFLTFVHLKDALKAAPGFIAKGLGMARDFMSNVAKDRMATPSTTGIATAGDAAPTINSTTNVTVPAGTTQAQAIDMVAKAHEKAFNNVLRSTRNQAVGGKKY